MTLIVIESQDAAREWVSTSAPPFLSWMSDPVASSLLSARQHCAVHLVGSKCRNTRAAVEHILAMSEMQANCAIPPGMRKRLLDLEFFLAEGGAGESEAYRLYEPPALYVFTVAEKLLVDDLEEERRQFFECVCKLQTTLVNGRAAFKFVLAGSLPLIRRTLPFLNVVALKRGKLRPFETGSDPAGTENTG